MNKIWLNIKLSFRQMVNKKLTTSINLIGLGIGLGSVILMLAMILHELSFDRYHKNSNHIYRITYGNNCLTPYIVGDKFKEDLPEIKNVFRIRRLNSVLIKKNNEFIQEEKCIAADSSLFSILDVPILASNTKFLLKNRSDVAISDIIAHKYFGNVNPIGKSLEVNNSGSIVICNITAVFKHFPSNSSIQADFIANISQAFTSVKSEIFFFGTSKELSEKEIMTSWDFEEFNTFVCLSENANVLLLEKKGTSIVHSFKKQRKESSITFQKFSTMYLHSENLINTGGLLFSNLSTIKIFEGIASLILIIACFNYILLSVAESRNQLKEIACRKVFGASNAQIMQKTFYLSTLIALLSLIPAFIFIEQIITYFNQFFNKNVDVTLFHRPVYLLSAVGVTLFTGFIAGGYVSFYSSRLTPVSLFNSFSAKKGTKGFIHSGGLIIFQFMVFILLCFIAITIEKQIQYSVNIDQGLNCKNVLVFRLNSNQLKKSVMAIKSGLESNPHVLQVATSAFTPPGNSFMYLEFGNISNTEQLKGVGMLVGAGLVELMQIPVIEGTSFSDESSNFSNVIMLNESASKKFKVRPGDRLGSFIVRGIVSDFHINSLHKAIDPVLILKIKDDECYELAVKTDGDNNSVINMAKTLWVEKSPTSTFDYELLENRIEKFYEKEKKQAKTITFFSSLALALAVMGLFGYVTIILLKRTKEIGIRKVNGASVFEIFLMLSKDFIKWIIIAFVVACPVAYYTMNKWLEDFAYKTNLSWWIYALSGAIAILVAFVTISWHSWMAAKRNPVESLRYE
jgi:putative ABC transport system permease protein